MKTNTKATAQLERDSHVLWPAFVIGGALFLLFAAFMMQGLLPRLVGLALVCYFAGLAACFAAHMFARANRKMAVAGQMHAAFEHHMDQVRRFIYDNPEIAADPRIRRAILPSDHELAVFHIHLTRVKNFTELREADAEVLKYAWSDGGLRLPLCLKPKGHDGPRYPAPSRRTSPHPDPNAREGGRL